MKNRVLNYLKELDRAVDKMSDEELNARVLKSQITPEVAGTYAFVERFVLNQSIEYDSEFLEQRSIPVSRDDSNNLAA